MQAAAGVAHHLELCSVVVQPEFDVTNEQFTYSENLVKQLGLTVEFSTYGVNINGKEVNEMMANIVLLKLSHV